MLKSLAVALIAIGIHSANAQIIVGSGADTYSYNVSQTSGVDPNAIYAGGGFVDAGPAYQDANPSFTGIPYSSTATYTFNAPTGFQFNTASVFNRADIFQQANGSSITGDFSIDGGSTFTNFFNLNTQGSYSASQNLTVSGSSSIIVLFTLNRSGARNAGDFYLFSSGLADSGFIFNSLTTAIPEPSTYALLLGGVGLLFGLRRFRPSA